MFGCDFALVVPGWTRAVSPACWTELAMISSQATDVDVSFEHFIPSQKEIGVVCLVVNLSVQQFPACLPTFMPPVSSYPPELFRRPLVSVLSDVPLFYLSLCCWVSFGKDRPAGFFTSVKCSADWRGPFSNAAASGTLFFAGRAADLSRLLLSRRRADPL